MTEHAIWVNSSSTSETTVAGIHHDSLGGRVENQE
jgi:hypothetical protein